MVVLSLSLVHTFPFYEFVVSFICIVYLVERWLDLRQLSKYSTTVSLPKELQNHVKEDKFQNSKAYGSAVLYTPFAYISLSYSHTHAHTRTHTHTHT